MYEPGYAVTLPPMVSVYTKQIGWMDEDRASSQPASATWESSNRAVYYPLLLPAVCIVRRVWWANGATTSGGATIEVGVYANANYGPGAKLVSGAATQGTASEVQFVDVTDTTLAPGLYWLAITSSTTTSTTLFRSSLNAAADADVRLQEESAQPLPSTATPIQTSA